jgi:hypothetical protein
MMRPCRGSNATTTAPAVGTKVAYVNIESFNKIVALF